MKKFVPFYITDGTHNLYDRREKALLKGAKT